jgi:hypothetical protein
MSRMKYSASREMHERMGFMKIIKEKSKPNERTKAKH